MYDDYMYSRPWYIKRIKILVVLGVIVGYFLRLRLGPRPLKGPLDAVLLVAFAMVTLTAGYPGLTTSRHLLLRIFGWFYVSVWTIAFLVWAYRALMGTSAI